MTTSLEMRASFAGGDSNGGSLTILFRPGGSTAKSACQQVRFLAIKILGQAKAKPNQSLYLISYARNKLPGVLIHGSSSERKNGAPKAKSALAAKTLRWLNKGIGTPGNHWVPYSYDFLKDVFQSIPFSIG